MRGEGGRGAVRPGHRELCDDAPPPRCHGAAHRQRRMRTSSLRTSSPPPRAHTAAAATAAYARTLRCAAGDGSVWPLLLRAVPLPRGDVSTLRRHPIATPSSPHRHPPRHPIANPLVTPSPQIVFERARQRALVTGRHVPESEILDSMERVPRSIELLAPLASFVATIDNSMGTPRLVRWLDSARGLEGARMSCVDLPNAPAGEAPHGSGYSWSEIRTRLKFRNAPPAGSSRAGRMLSGRMLSGRLPSIGRSGSTSRRTEPPQARTAPPAAVCAPTATAAEGAGAPLATADVGAPAAVGRV